MNPNLANGTMDTGTMDTATPTLTYSVVAHWETGASVMYVSTSEVKAERECARMARTERVEGVSYLVSVCALESD